MCGIAGIVGAQASAELARDMAQRLYHRGPDGDGVWTGPGVALSHRRLAIQDLTDAGRQPMVYGAHVLTYNGELYNHERLRASLPGPWASSGDTEVVLRLLATEGRQCLERLVGMFALASWDSDTKRLLLVRDRLGIKPLYYRPLGEGIAFASELKALMLLGSAEVDRSAVRDFLFHGYIPAPKTIYRGIYKLPAAHTLSWQDGRISIERYWNPSPAIVPRSAADTTAELDALLGEVIPQHTVSDVPVGVFLSGGIDSALTAYYLDAPRTYTLGFEAGGRSEADAARQVAAHLDTEHLEMTAPQADFAGALELMPAMFDEPFGDSAAWSNYLVAQFARREVTVALSGEGGDEIFCGYPRYWSHVGERSNFLNRTLARFLPPLSRLASSMQRRGYVGLPAYAAALGGMTGRQIDSLLAPSWLAEGYDYLWFYRQYWREDLPALPQLRWLDLNTDLAEGLLTKVDRTSMAHSLEVRPPLLDHRLVEFMLSVDPDLLVDRQLKRGKLLVRRLMEPRLPPNHVNRPKSGFGLPLHRWLKEHPELLAAAVRRLMERGILRRAVDVEFRRAWYVLVLDSWFTAFA
ncbi:MAG TPA: asparagine synthase (glutamine-hydrolyzing) [Steroidobacteraceae bacterium]|jgi:asparagine synthase (glutamine-hydrolysing)|nr:asparagine synthase (glutamine-hydrolyzing) [Steroidobacteraceae bacterium]